MSRLEAELRKDQIMDAAIQLAEIHGYENVKRTDVAQAANVSNGLITRYCGTMNQLRIAIMQHAVTTGNLAVLIQGIARGDHQALNAPDELKAAAVTYFTNIV